MNKLAGVVSEYVSTHGRAAGEGRFRVVNPVERATVLDEWRWVLPAHPVGAVAARRSYPLE